MATTIIRGTAFKNETFTQNGLTFNVAKTGRVCVITCSAGSVTSAVAAGGTLLTLGNDYLPLFQAYTQNLTSFSTRIIVNDTGNVTSVVAANAGTSYRFTLTYITAN